ncbi:hypothetical protein D6810_00495 [Candidatus Dojkabacteria bacterium]|uniref:(d)CMP kinase n=1 Tax=Candidatus Dojkabacteria bacterium TaxID=2099670 RepID=A0A3M0Z1T0_9BACT|nr:MAG: hypothetical protein D6810_00495 [Candidatus Dojkabacteria bacterium]
MKLVVSGLPGCGSSTLALLCSYLFNFKLIKGSSSFRFLAKKLGAKTNHEETMLIEKEIQPYWGPIYDKFIRKVLEELDLDNICIDSDIAGFMTDSREGLVRVFLYADLDERIKRFKKDKREASTDLILKIDKKIQNEYKQLYGFDFLNIEYVKTKYELLVDNSNKSIAEELKIVYEYTTSRGYFKIDLNEYDFENSEKIFLEKGKVFFEDQLYLNKNLIDGEEVVRLVCNHMHEDVEKLPKKLGELISN